MHNVISNELNDRLEFYIDTNGFQKRNTFNTSTDAKKFCTKLSGKL